MNLMHFPDNIERRLAPRYDNKLQIDLLLSDTEILPIEICSISLHGLQMNCDGWLADEIEPQGIQKLALSRKKLKIRANLPFDNSFKKIIINTHVAAVRRLSQDEFLIGLEFEDYEDNSEGALKEYIEMLDTELE